MNTPHDSTPHIPAEIHQNDENTDSSLSWMCRHPITTVIFGVIALCGLANCNNRDYSSTESKAKIEKSNDEFAKQKTEPAGSEMNSGSNDINSIQANISPEQRASIQTIEKLKAACAGIGLISCKYDINRSRQAWQGVASSYDNYLELCSRPKLDKTTGHYISTSSDQFMKDIMFYGAANRYMMQLKAIGSCYNDPLDSSTIYKELRNLEAIASASPDYQELKRQEEIAKEERITQLTSLLKARSSSSPTCLSTCLRQAILDEIMALKGVNNEKIPELYLRTNGKTVPGGYTRARIEAQPNVSLCKKICEKE